MKKLLPLLLLSLALAACTSMEEKRDSHMNAALEAEQRGDCTVAGSQAREAADLDPLFAEAHLLLGRCALKEDRPKDAGASFAKALELRPDSMEALAGAARAALLDDDLDKASSYLEKAENAGGDSGDLAVIRAGLHLKKREYEAAIPLFEAVLEKKPENEEAVVGLASAYINAGMREKAADLLTASVEKLPQSPAVLSLLLTIALQDNDFAKAEDYLQRLQSQRPEDPALVLQLSDLRLMAGKEEEALGVLTDFLQKHPDSDTVRVRLADNEAARGDFDQALSVLDAAPAQTGLIRLTKASVLGRSGRTDEAENLLKALAADPNAKAQITEARLGLVEIFLEGNRLEEAEKELSLLLADEPQNSDALFLRGRVFFTLGRYGDAIKDYSRVLDINENDYEAALALADAYNASRDSERAEQIISNVIKRAPKYSAAYTTLVNLYMMRRQPEAALMTLSIGKKELPDEPLLPVLEADILASLSRFDEAAKLLEELAKKDDLREAVLLRLAAVHGMAKQYAKAAGIYERLLKANPELAAAAEGYIKTKAAEGKTKDALAFAEKRGKDRPEDPIAAFMLADAAFADKNTAKAEAALLQAIKLAPAWDLPLTELARHYTATGRIDEAIEVARTSMANAPEVSGPAVVLAMLQEEKDDLDAAEATYRSILTNEPQNYLAANNLAFLLSRHNPDPARLEEAEKLAELASATGAPATFDTLGWVRFLRGDNDGAEEAVRRAARGMPDNPVIAFHLASILAAQSKEDGRKDTVARVDEAKALLKTVVESKEDFPQKSDAKKLLESLQ